MAVKTPTKPTKRAATAGSEKPGRPSRLTGSVAAAVPSGAPLELPLDAVTPDPNQPRRAKNPGYTPEKLTELANSIKARGQKQAISVRVNPNEPGRYFINHGERRWRACHMAGLATVKAFIDNDFERVDQVIENLQREDLTAREIADFIGQELARGKRKTDIARELGKSNAFVTQHVILLDLPDPIAQAFDSGRVKDVTVIHELVVALQRYPTQVAAWIENKEQEITRGTVRGLREYLEEIRQLAAPTPASAVELVATEEVSAEPAPSLPSGKSSDRMHRAWIEVAVGNRAARLLTTRRPTAPGRAWVCYLTNEQEEVEVELAEVAVRLVSVHEG
ncbi:ParB/RepB/Spo0J family partition protein [Azohydromonas australica]|uniref:ParB/RepB/Spo0J family partition protein n=1 Tax=Azohydromonas australica TaxID=364039 RepID=UPI00048E1E0B|nr:ParB/RepB/Spo0J family partition protein [Azohydromonas australica]